MRFEQWKGCLVGRAGRMRILTTSFRLMIEASWG